MSDRTIRKSLRSHERRGPQGLRRPRFSFFLFSCQTARGGSPTPLLQGAPKLASQALFRRRMTTGQLPAVCALISVRSFKGHGTMPWPVGQCSAALSGWVISSRFVYCQRLSSTNCRIAQTIRAGRQLPERTEVSTSSCRTRATMLRRSELKICNVSWILGPSRRLAIHVTANRTRSLRRNALFR